MAGMKEEDAQRSSWAPIDLSPYLTAEWKTPFEAGHTIGLLDGLSSARALVRHALRESECISNPGMYGDERSFTGVEDPSECGYHKGLRQAMKLIEDYRDRLKAYRETPPRAKP